MKHVFIIGSKGIPAKYGGFETFVENLTARWQNKDVFFHVACMAEESKEPITYNGAECFFVKVPSIGSAKAVYYDLAAFRWCLKKIRKDQIQEPIVYVLACRIGPFVGELKRELSRLGGKLFVNPDGHEFLRAKWSAPIQKYWKKSESLMTKHADLLICDSKCIGKYIKKEYKKYDPKATFIAYGTDIPELRPASDALLEWYGHFGLKAEDYYLVVGRFVPENNYETMLREFMASDSKKKFVLITNIEQNEFYDELKAKTHFDEDPRIIFPGTVYDQELLAQIRMHAFAYFHGHEVGGTNPSLLEALGMTKLNLLLDVGFNREVAEDAAVYWSKNPGFLAGLIHGVEQMSEGERSQYGEKARARMKECYSWESIVEKYEQVFTDESFWT